MFSREKVTENERKRGERDVLLDGQVELRGGKKNMQDYPRQAENEKQTFIHEIKLQPAKSSKM